MGKCNGVMIDHCARKLVWELFYLRGVYIIRVLVAQGDWVVLFPGEEFCQCTVMEEFCCGGWIILRCMILLLLSPCYYLRYASVQKGSDVSSAAGFCYISNLDLQLLIRYIERW